MLKHQSWFYFIAILGPVKERPQVTSKRVSEGLNVWREVCECEGKSVLLDESLPASPPTPSRPPPWSPGFLDGLPQSGINISQHQGGSWVPRCCLGGCSYSAESVFLAESICIGLMCTREFCFTVS